MSDCGSKADALCSSQTQAEITEKAASFLAEEGNTLAAGELASIWREVRLELDQLHQNPIGVHGANDAGGVGCDDRLG